ncbi:MAG: hypothetical protein LBI12_03630 [Treponema sp.]|jgi:V/A-type H+-transporting ATPase subunit I|nr:hypothetical protein [Treponema sp.]
MKKVFIAVFEKERIVSLEKLREAGIMHIEKKPASSEALNELMSRKTMLSKAIGVLHRYPVHKNHPPPSKPYLPSDLTAYVLRLINERDVLLGELVILKPERRRIEEWGEFDPYSLDDLLQHGIKLFFYKLPTPVYNRINEKINFIILSKDKKWVKAAAVGSEIPEMHHFTIPGQSLSELDQQIEVIKRRLKEIEKNLEGLAYYIETLEDENSRLLEEIEFETVKAGMGSLENNTGGVLISCLSGYIPCEKIDVFKKAAAENGWAFKLEDPSITDRPPTVLKNKNISRIINPLFSMLGTIPGYWEYDIRFSYMVFLCFFFAMILGDAVYGSLLFILGGTIGLIFKKKKGIFPDAAKLLMLLSFCTIVWGSLTGSWFGIPSENLPSFLQLLIIQPFNDTGPLAEFPRFLQNIFSLPAAVPEGALKTQWNIQFLCFTIGMTQLVWGRGKNIRKLLPSLTALAEAGWLLTMLGIYFLVLFMLLKTNLPSFVLWFIGAGIVLNFIFSEQKGGNFAKNIGKSFANFFPILLKIIGSFADIVSYIRLFAVGLAGGIIIQTINSMAIPQEGLGSFGFGFLLKLTAMVLILVFGHVLHLLMNALSVIVHGLRLNLLEYAGNHLGMEWSGFPYNPFALQKKK